METIDRGDMIVYEYACKLREAKVLRVYGDYIKVRHIDLWLLGTTDLVHMNEIKGVSKKGGKFYDRS